MTTIGTNCMNRCATRASGRDMRGKLRLWTSAALEVIDFAPVVKHVEKYSNIRTPMTRNATNDSTPRLVCSRKPNTSP